MRLDNLKVCLLLSILINAVGFAPTLSFLMGHSPETAPTPIPSLKIHILHSPLQVTPTQLDKPAVSTPIKPELSEKKTVLTPPTLQPTKLQATKEVRPSISGKLPDKHIPQARPRRLRTQNQSSPTSPQSAPAKVFARLVYNGPISETAVVSENIVHQDEKTQLNTVPERNAVPKSNPPNNFSKAVLKKIGGKLIIQLQVKIYPDGHIDTLILTTSGYSELDEAILKDLKDWRWDPARVAGRPVLSERTVRLTLESD